MGKKRSITEKMSKLSLLVFMLSFLLAPCSRAQDAASLTFPTRTLGSVAAIGDSITKAFDAKYSDFGDCRYKDTPEHNFSTSKTSNTTFSIAERAISYKGSGVATANFGADGARMSSGVDQALEAKAWASNQAAPRLVTVFLGHNDICGGEKDKYQGSCARADRDPNNYCRTSTFYYEYQMRQMLDVLVTIPSSQIAIIHPTRVSQICNFATEKVVDETWLTLRCEDLWTMPNLFGEDGVCPSLTGCSAERIADAYTTWVSYRDIGDRLVEEYNLVGSGQTVPSNPTFGTGGVVRASDVSLQATGVFGNQKYQYRNPYGDVMLSVCECFHPSKFGQNLLAASLWAGVTCSATTPCCNDEVEGDSDYNKGLCNNYTVSGSMSGPWASGKTLTVAKAGSGKGVVTSVPTGIDCGNDCSQFYDEGAVVALTALANANSTFTGWSGAGCSGTETCSVTMDNSKTVTATFARSQKLVVNKRRVGKGDGTVTSAPSGISCGPGCTSAYAFYTLQQEVTLTAAADTGSVFAGWLPASICSGTGSCIVTMDKAKTVQATFAGPQKLTVRKQKVNKGDGTVTSAPEGINCGAVCSAFFTFNREVALTATPDEGSTFTGWRPKTLGCTDTAPCTITMNKARTAAAVFTKNKATHGEKAFTEGEE